MGLSVAKDNILEKNKEYYYSSALCYHLKINIKCILLIQICARGSLAIVKSFEYAHEQWQEQTRCKRSLMKCSSCLEWMDSR